MSIRSRAPSVAPSGDLESGTSAMREDRTPSAAIKEYTTPSAPIKQWAGAVNLAVKAANRFRENIRVGAVPVGQEITDHEESSNGQNEILLAQSRMQSTTSQQPFVQGHAIEYFRIAHTGLVQQLNAYGIVLTLLAGVMCVAILQPPGSFDDYGHIRPYKLVACYLLFASLSFLLACTGLFAVIVGSASLFRPLFFQKLNQRGSDLVLSSQDRRVYDDISTLHLIIEDNLSRVRRLKTYLGFSLGFCMTAFVCGAFAILGPGMRNLLMALGTIGLSSIILLFEAWMTWRGPALPEAVLQRLQRIIH